MAFCRYRKTPLVPKEKVAKLLETMPNWKLHPDEKSISRQFSTRNFVAGRSLGHRGPSARPCHSSLTRIQYLCPYLNVH